MMPSPHQYKTSDKETVSTPAWLCQFPPGVRLPCLVYLLSSPTFTRRHVFFTYILVYVPSLISKYMPSLIYKDYVPSLISKVYVFSLISKFHVPSLISKVYVLPVPSLISKVYVPSLISSIYITNLIPEDYDISQIYRYKLQIRSQLGLPSTS